jgi:hypothetical protein
MLAVKIGTNLHSNTATEGWEKVGNPNSGYYFMSSTH